MVSPAVRPLTRGQRAKGRFLRSRILRGSMLALLSCWLMAACATGPRPTLAEGTSIDEPIGDIATDLVLAQFAQLDAAAFTASYTITNNFGPIIREAIVTHDGIERRSVTVGEVRFLLIPDGSSTCRLLTGDCTDGANDAAISDLQVTHQFYSRSAAARLRNDASRRVGPTDSYTAEIAGQQVSCVSVPVAGGSKVYCVTSTGVLAAYQGPDVLIELIEYSNQVNQDLFSRAG